MTARETASDAALLRDAIAGVRYPPAELRSFALHTPLELLARFALLPHVAPTQRFHATDAEHDALWSELATEAAIRNDAHLVKHTLSALELARATGFSHFGCYGSTIETPVVDTRRRRRGRRGARP
jgi:hypothetical protein